MAKIIFFGTPKVSTDVLLDLIKTDHQIVAVFTEPDSPAGRGLNLQPSPVKTIAQKHGIPVLQPTNSTEITSLLKQYPADLSVVVAYGKIIPPAALELPNRGFVNIHPSLLPEYRGAAPVQHTILNGETETGVTIIQLDQGMDSGQIIAQITEAVRDDDTTESLLNRLMKLGSQSLIKNLDAILDGSATLTPQDERRATYAPKLTKETGKIDWSNPPQQIDYQVRACIPWPRAFTDWRGERLLVLAGEVKDNRYWPTIVQKAGGKAQNWETFCHGVRLDPITALKELTNQN